ncbi:MAG: glycogen/starch/alpha-glucan phosphorylase [Clostridia bacterium]|nr:glycogen/starch/alpha-glucan phosphorylase [Clostridia bacterium]
MKDTQMTLENSVEEILSRYFGLTSLSEANDEQLYKAVLLCVRDILAKKRSKFKKYTKKQNAKKVYYLCLEFLVGRSLRNNICNLGLEDEFRTILEKIGCSLERLYEIEPDAALGNGGLGRLAACYMDALTTLDYPATGFSILYEYGLFKQKVIDGDQIELPDEWMPMGSSWLVPRTDKTCNVRMGGKISENWIDGRCEIVYTDYDEIQAVPYDMMISGGDSTAVNILRLWKANDTHSFNMNLFSQGQYIKALEENNNADIISKVLYPADNHTEGKLLRLSQQYFLVCASLQSIINDHLATYGSLDNFAEKVAIHINDTHPALVVPELMRVLIDTYSYSWDDAWSIVTQTVSYTNHTVMPEALETWNEDLFAFKLPRIHMIIKEINRRLSADLWSCYPGDWDRIARMSVMCDGQIRMANLSVVASHTVNGVSALHSDILKKTVFHDYYKHTPGKFTNVTNGIAHRRWLCYSNSELAGFLDETIGCEYRKDASKLTELLKYADDSTVLEKLAQIKKNNKVRFANYLKQRNGITIDPDSIFDVQVKRMHEYKRQLLNVIRIISLYVDLKNDPNYVIPPQTYIFGAKAAPGYYMAKQIIKLIHFLAKEIENDPRISKMLRVVFVEDYNVSVAETLIPAADISEQISLAGKEASGTGNMKFMINGAVTIGTLDGANVEIGEAVGNDNIYIFGHTTEEVDELWKQGYSSIVFYNKCQKLRQAIDALHGGFAGRAFTDFVTYLIAGQRISDPFMCLADFDSYYNVHNRMINDYLNSAEWNRKSLVNTASAGIFAADRSIREYAENIWNIKPVKEQ